MSFVSSHLEQYADGGGHADHADTHHRHLVLAADWLLLHHMADQFLLGGHLFMGKGHRGSKVGDLQFRVIEKVKRNVHTGGEETA